MCLFDTAFYPYGTSASTVYVSQESGNDSADCGSQSFPCRTISRGIYQASWGSTINLDGTNSEQNPFKCQSMTSSQKGIYINKTLSFVGIRSRAYIACGVGEDWLLDGTNTRRQVIVNFTELAFENSRLHFLESSVTVNHCRFWKTEKLVMNFTILGHENPFKLSFKDVVFEQNEACIVVTSGSTSHKTRKIHIAMKNSLFTDNGRRDVPLSSSIQSTVLWLDSAKNYILDVSMKNTTFLKNFVRTDGMVYLGNEFGETKLFLEQTVFSGNGRQDTRSTNSLFVLSCQNLLLIVETTQVLKSEARLLSATADVSQISVSSAIIDDCISSRLHGGVLYIDGEILDLLVENCSFNNGYGRSSPGHGGAFYISGQNTTIVINNSNFTNVRCAGYGGVLYILSSRSHANNSVLADLTVQNSTFTTNSATIGGVFFVDLPIYASFSTTIKNCKFSSNHANEAGVMKLFTLNSAKLLLSNIIFERNSCSGNGAVLYSGYKTSFPTGGFLSMAVTNVTFFQNHVSGPGGVMSLRTSDITCLYFRNVSFVENQGLVGGALYVSNENDQNNLRFELVTNNVRFADSRATAGPGGAVYLIPKSRLTIVSLEKTRFESNKADNAPGGALYTETSHDTQFNLNGCLFEKNSGFVGGAIYLEGRVTFSIRDSIFQSNDARNPGAAIFLQIQNSTLRLVNATFFDNSCAGAGGGSLYLELSNNCTVSISNASFKNNTAVRAFGGAFLAKMSEDRLNQSGCMPSTWRSWIYNNRIQFKNSLFERNVAAGGGALSLTNGKATFTNCTFVNNFAAVQSGHISNYGSNSLEFLGSYFLQTRDNETINSSDFHLPSFIQTFSAGPLVLLNSTIDQHGHQRSEPLVMVSKGGLVHFDNFSSVICPKGSFVSRLNLSYPDRENDSCTVQVTVLRLSCQECNPGFYSLQRGYTKGLTIVKDFTCFPCPQGADCFPSIKSKPNFWGYLAQTDPPALNFTLCPLGYCRSPSKTSKSYNSCHGNRQGFMCGTCKTGYSDELLSTDCSLAKNCNDHWFWVVSVVLVFVMALFLILKPSFVTFAAKQMFWFKQLCVRQAHKPSRFLRFENSKSALRPVDKEQETGLQHSTEQVKCEKSQSVSFFEIIFYFYQISNLLLTSTSLEELVKTKIIPPTIGFFNFQQKFSGGGHLCPFPGLTPQTKKLFEIAPVLGAFIAIYIIYGLHCIICRIFKVAAPRFGPYLEATMETLLLGYVTVANVSLSLVQCVSIGSESRWFYNGELVCFQWWQYALIGFNIVVIVPFMFVLAWGSLKLHHGKVSAKELLFGLLFPLPVLAYWLLHLIRCNVNDTTQDVECTMALKEVLHEPFRKPEIGNKGTLYWESVLIGRRFILVFLYCFITDTSIRLMCMTLVCVIVCLHHSKVEPFRNPNANLAETVSLLALVILALINLYKSIIVSSERQIKGSLVVILKAFDWIEILLLGCFPTIFLIVIALGVVSLFTRLIFGCCGYLYERITTACFCGSVANECNSILDTAS